MAQLEINNVAIRGISAAVPSNLVTTNELYKPNWGRVEDFLAATNISERRVSSDSQTTSDLCVAATEKLIEELGWDKSEVDALVFVTQTPDYLFCPATACIIQDRLGLPQTCMAFDVTLGCSGYVYGLSILGSLMQTGQIKKGLLLAGDTPTKHNSKNDGSTTPLFGDAGTATALEFDKTWEHPMSLSLCTDGSGWDAIVIREGGFRNPFNAESLIEKDYGDGHLRKGIECEMDGMSVFSFAISKVPKTLKALLETHGDDDSTIDVLTMHQANKMINEKILKKIKISPDKMIESLSHFGNTSSASIPLTLVTAEAESLRTKSLRHLVTGFGIGLSWGGVLFNTESIVVPKLVEI